MRWRALLLGVALTWPSSLACTTDIEVGRVTSEGRAVVPEPEAGVSVPPTEAATPDAVAPKECVEVRCRGPLLQCGDCLDNDEDGLVDADDPDCFGPCSDTETTLAGRTQACSNEACFFDLDCGVGNDVPCLDLVPNGCDCRGCCEVGGRTVFLGSVDTSGLPTCTSSAFGDPELCQSCELDTSCLNSCDACELCFGSDELTDCASSDAVCPVPSCAETTTACSAECELGCPVDHACITGCCVDLGPVP